MYSLPNNENVQGRMTSLTLLLPSLQKYYENAEEVFSISEIACNFSFETQ